ncbi:MAG: DJ-1 family protein [Marinilabiliales bacterium]|nr:MAG: DJ-1 family protein [Marinilabiliales bacterium]
MKKVLLLLAQGFEIYEASVFIDVMGWNLVDGDGTTQLYTCGFSKEVKSSFNQKFVVDCLINEVNIDEYDALAIPGGFEEYGFYQEAYRDDFAKIIRSFNAQNKPICSICTGALSIANSGILDGKNATTYFTRRKQLEDFGVKVIEKPVVQEDNITTSWNPSTALDVAFQLLKKLTSKANAENVKSLMGF